MAQCSSKAMVPCNSEQKVLVSERAIEMFLPFGIPFCRMQHEPAICRIFTLGGRRWDRRLGTEVGNRLKQIGNRAREQKLETRIKNRGWERE